jgi:hypothetical protein
MKPQPPDIAKFLSRLSVEQFKRLAKLIAAEQKRRAPGKSPGAMTDAEFRQWADEQMRNADAVFREKDLRDQLGGKAAKPNDPKKENDDE